MFFQIGIIVMKCRFWMVGKIPYTVESMSLYYDTQYCRASGKHRRSEIHSNEAHFKIPDSLAAFVCKAYVENQERKRSRRDAVCGEDSHHYHIVIIICFRHSIRLIAFGKFRDY